MIETPFDNIKISEEEWEKRIKRLYETERFMVDPKSSYPYSDEFLYESSLPRINFDEERENDIRTGKGFIISSPKATLKKDIKNPDGIFSSKYGQRLGDENPYMDRFSCQCGNLRHSINHGLLCEKCHTICKFVGDDFEKFGWLIIKPEFAIINPDMYKNLDSLFGFSKNNKFNKKKRGSVLKNIINYEVEMDIDGHVIGPIVVPDEPFYGIGMLEFVRRFDEILEYYHKKFPKKIALYEDICIDRDKLFIHSIPVYTIHLRPVDISDGSMFFEKTSGIYNMMSKLVSNINKSKTKTDNTKRLKNLQLFNLQMKYMELYDEIIKILSGKKGNLRMLVSGRFNFTSREVIKQDTSLRIDQVKLPYVELVITQEQRIINILHRTYNISFQDAYDKWYKALNTVDTTIVEIIESLIASEKGIPVLINRNPTISFGGIDQMFCVGINYNYCLSISNQILVPLAADYDGDELNVLHIINDAFFWRSYEIFNPRNNMYISKNDGMCNSQVLPQRDSIINLNTLIGLSRKYYTEEELAEIKSIKKLVDY